PQYASHLGGFCSKCKNRSVKLYCPSCHRKTIPERVTCDQCHITGRSFRLLVEWLRFGKFKGSWIEELSPPVREVFETHRQPSPSHFQRRQNTSILSPDTWKLVKKKLSPPDSEWGFYDWLLLAWSVQQGNQEQAIQNQALTEIIDVTFRSATPPTAQTMEKFRSMVLALSYVPQPLLDMAISIRTTLSKDRKRESSNRRRQSQKTGTVQEPKAEMIREQIFFSQFGIDKMTPDLSRQVFWTWLFVPLVDFLLPYATRRKEDHWPSSETKPIDPTEADSPILPDDVFQKASQLLHLRYPDLWKDQWQMVKLRFHRHLRRH
ncbi:MAG: hypothetical protein KC587_14435, partial [Nitrospira sp.]|nr:hypothetical protein [Nitrospira sp.]